MTAYAPPSPYFMTRTTPPFYLVAMLAVLAGVPGASASTVVLNRVSDGHSRLRDDGIVFSSSTSNVVGEGIGLEYRTFISFSLTGINDPVVALTLRLKIESYNNGATSSQFSIFDYINISPTSIIDNGEAHERFDDLGSGVLYGTGSITIAENPAGSFLDIVLNSNAIAALNSGSGVYTSPSGARSFIVGIADQQISGTDNFGIRFTNGSGTRINQLVVETVPEPSSLVLIGVGCAALICRMRRRNRSPYLG